MARLSVQKLLCNVNVNLYSALSHSAPNALDAPNTAEANASSTVASLNCAWIFAAMLYGYVTLTWFDEKKSDESFAHIFSQYFDRVTSTHNICRA